MQTSTFITKTLKIRIKTPSPSISLALNNSLKIRFIVEPIYSGNLHHLLPQMLKVF